MSARHLNWGLTAATLLLGSAAATVACNWGPQTATPIPLPDAAQPSPDAAVPPTPDAPTGSTIGILKIKTLSNRADLISGGDALVEIVLPAGAQAANLHVKIGSRDVSSAFAARDGGRIVGLLTGLDAGANFVTADVGGQGAAKLII